MKIAIHHDKASWSFSNEWIRYCQDNGYDYKIVNAFDSDIIDQIKDCEIFMWHHNHMIHRDRLIAKQILYSLQQSGKVVFPDFNTGWHFDDKLGQKYLLEACDAPLVPSYAFYDWERAKSWINHTDFPKVFKLRGGSGSSNVMLIHSRREALKLTKKALRNGIPVYNKKIYLKEALRRFRNGKSGFKDIAKALAHYVVKTPLQRESGNEIGYVYFQDFIPDNTFDIRVVVINGKYGLGEKRYTRKGDFRASGSGDFDYEGIDVNAVKTAFDVAKKLKLQSVAFDFVLNNQGSPLIVEMSYGFGTHGISHVPGYWTDDLQWHKNSNFNFYGEMIEDAIRKVKSEK